MSPSPELIAIIGFLWTLHHDVAGLRERIARLEGLFEGVHPPRVRTAACVAAPRGTP